MQILDHLLGHNDSALFRRAQLKALVSIHGKEVGFMALLLQYAHSLPLCSSTVSQSISPNALIYMYISLNHLVFHLDNLWTCWYVEKMSILLSHYNWLSDARV